MAKSIVEVEGPLDREPEAHIQLNAKMAKKAQKFKPGQDVEIRLSGKLCSVSFHDTEEDEGGGCSGSTCVEFGDLEISAVKKNQIEGLLDDDE